MESCKVVENIYLLVIVTLISVLQNVFFAQKVERECKDRNIDTSAFERVSCANRNCMDAYPTFLAVMWCAGLCLNQAPAAFAGIIYLLVRQKYFIGYLGQSSQSTPGYLFGKRIIFFLSLMCIVGIFNYLLWRFYGSDYKEYVETITSAGVCSPAPPVVQQVPFSEDQALNAPVLSAVKTSSLLTGLLTC